MKRSDELKAEARERQRSAGGDKKSSKARSKSLVADSPQAIEPPKGKTREKLAKKAKVSELTPGQAKMRELSERIHGHAVAARTGATVPKTIEIDDRTYSKLEQLGIIAKLSAEELGGQLLRQMLGLQEGKTPGRWPPKIETRTKRSTT